MKKIFVTILILFVFKFSFGQYPITQNIGSGSTLVQVPYPGGILANIINRNYTDTSAANLTNVKFYSGAQIYTTLDSSLWWRYNGSWVRLASSSGGADGGSWLLTGNIVPDRVPQPYLGTKTPVELPFKTNDTVRMTIPSYGIRRNNDNRSKYLMIDTVIGNVPYLTYGDGGGSGGSGWNLTGNAGTTAGTNFLGTTDNQYLDFRVNNQLSGRIMNNWPWNTLFGYRSGASLTTGSINTFIGWGAGEDNIDGSSNVGIGLSALGHTSGADDENVAVGFGALANVSNHRNVAVGTSAMVNSRNAEENTAVGNYSMLANRQGDFNNAYGSSALRGNTDGSYNAALGNISLTQNTTAVQSIAVTAVGSGYTTATVVISPPVVAADPNNNSLQATATATLSGGSVVSITITEPGKGYSSYSPPTATIIGDGTGATLSVTLTSGENNTGVGVSSLVSNRTGKNNTALGKAAGASIDTGHYNLFLGSNAGFHASQKVNVRSSIAIGPNAYTTANNQFVISDSATRFTFPGISRGTAGDVLTDSLGNGQYWVARPIPTADPTGWDDMLAVGQTQTADRTANINSNRLSITNANQLSIADNLSNERVYIAEAGIAISAANRYLTKISSGTNTTFSRMILAHDTITFLLGTDKFRVRTLPSGAGTKELRYNPSNGEFSYADTATGGGGLTVGTTTITSGTNARILYDNSGVLGEYAITGSGTTVPLSTTPTFTTSIITPITYGSTTANGTLTLAGNSASSSNTGTNTNTLFKAGNSGSTLVMATYNAGNVAIGPTPSVNANTALTIQSLTNNQGEGLRVYALNNSVYTELGWGRMSYSGRFVYNTGSHAFTYSSGTGLYLGADAAATAQLHISAGSATAGTAPLKFTSGVSSQTTKEAGAVNYNGSNLTLSDATYAYTLVKSLPGSATLDFGSTAAGTSTDLTITVTGAADGDVVSLGVPNGSTVANGLFTAWVSAANTVTVRFSNNSLVTAYDPASGTFKVNVIK